MSDSAARRRDRQPHKAGSSVLTPPWGMSALGGSEPQLPTQRTPSEPRTPAPAAASVEPCICGHARATHEHYRPGTDCGACGADGCGQFHGLDSGLVRKLLRRAGLRG